MSRKFYSLFFILLSISSAFASDYVEEELVQEELTPISQKTFLIGIPETPVYSTEPYIHNQVNTYINTNYIVCPFDTDLECDIWKKKPAFSQTLAPRASKLRTDKMSVVIEAIRHNLEICADDENVAPLLERYKMLMRASNSCCTVGSTYALRKIDKTEGEIYKFLSDDANFYNFTNRCLVMSNEEIKNINFSYIQNSKMFDVRDGCICRSRQWFENMLTPFNDVYDSVPEFKDAEFSYTYIDGLGREIKASVNQDVQNVIELLKTCP